jgi:hypothetical protein
MPLLGVLQLGPAAPWAPFFPKLKWAIRAGLGSILAIVNSTLHDRYMCVDLVSDINSSVCSSYRPSRNHWNSIWILGWSGWILSRSIELGKTTSFTRTDRFSGYLWQFEGQGFVSDFFNLWARLNIQVRVICWGTGWNDCRCGLQLRISIWQLAS